MTGDGFIDYGLIITRAGDKYYINVNALAHAMQTTGPTKWAELPLNQLSGFIHNYLLQSTGPFDSEGKALEAAVRVRDALRMFALLGVN